MNIKSSLEKDTTSRLKTTHSLRTFNKSRINTAGSNILLLEKTVSLIERMKEHKIQIMLLKGAALIENIYSDVSQRAMEDVDILVKQEKLNKARDIITRAGYKLLGTNQANSEVYVLEAFFKIHLDLHWQIVNLSSPSQKHVYWPDENLIWQRAVNINLGNKTVLGMCPEDLLVYLCFHALKERFSHRKWLVDLKLVLTSKQEEIDWDKFFSIARDSGTDKLCGLIMGYLNKECAVDVPTSVLLRIRKNYPHLPLEERIFHFLINDFSFMRELLWPLAMNSRKKQMLFFRTLPAYIWKKLCRKVFISYK